MSNTLSTAALVAVIATAVLASTAVHAQTKALQNAPPQPRELDPAKRVPPAAAHQHAPQPVQSQPAAQPYVAPQPTAQAEPYAVPQPYSEAAPARASYEENRGGFFIGVQGGKGWVYDDVDQSALSVNAGYRWQAGAVTLVGIELAGGKLDSTTDDGWRYEEVDYASIGVNARFNFGHTSPVYALVRAGYFTADEAGYDMDGGYLGLGLGVDFNRHFNMSLVYTNYVYFDSYGWYEGDFYYDANRADTLMLGAEVRF